MTGLLTGADGRRRCWWPSGDAGYVRYHDEEWGRPVADDVRLFEKLCLEGFQSGLSWLTILRKRGAFRRAFAGFDFHALARWNRRSVDRLLEDASIVRHRGKIESVLNNARRACELAAEAGSLARHLWSFEPPQASRPRRLDRRALMRLSQSDASRALAGDLKRRGWTYVGPTTVYAFMQAVGLVDDHLDGCAVRDEVEAERRAFRRP